MWVARCGSDFAGAGDSFEFFSEERNKLPLSFLSERHLLRLAYSTNPAH